MVTVVTKSIGTAGGRDYSTMQAWEDAAPANLVTADQIWRGECYNDSLFTAPLTISGSTADATRYKELTVAAGHSFVDHVDRLTDALRWDQSKGVAIQTGDWQWPVLVDEGHARVSRLQVRSTSEVGNKPLQAQGNIGHRFEQCIFWADFGEAAYLWNSVAENCLFVAGSGRATIVTRGETSSLRSCTLAVPSNLTPATTGIGLDYPATGEVRNCVIVGAVDAGGTTNTTYVNCYTDDATPPPGCTTIAYDTSTGSGFENTTSAAADFRIKGTSALIDVGTATGAPGVDIVGTTRPQGAGVDVGCWEYSAAASPASLPPVQSLFARMPALRRF